MFLHLSVILFGGVSLSRGVSLQGGLCLGGLCPGGLYLSRGVFAQGYFCPGKGVSVWGVSVQGVSVRERLHRIVTCGWYMSRDKAMHGRHGI